MRSRDDALSPDIALQGWSARGEGGLRLQKHFCHGSFAEQIWVPTETIVRIGALDEREAARWCASGTLLVPYGGFLAANLQAGETVLVGGATGHFGSAAVAVAVVMGQCRRTERNEAALADLARRFGPRLRPVKLLGDVDGDRERMRHAARGPIDCVPDVLPPWVSTTTARAAVMAVRPHRRVDAS